MAKIALALVVMLVMAATIPTADPIAWLGIAVIAVGVLALAASEVDDWSPIARLGRCRRSSASTPIPTTRRSRPVG